MLQFSLPHFYIEMFACFSYKEDFCHLQSLVVSVSLSFLILFIALPKAPGIPVVTERTATSITLTWDSGNPEPVSYYIIQVRDAMFRLHKWLEVIEARLHFKTKHRFKCISTVCKQGITDWQTQSACFPSQHRAKGSDDPYKEIDGIATTRYSVGGLSPYSHYDFRVAAVNTIGQGPSSDAVEARTAEQAPSSPPRQVRRRVSRSGLRDKRRHEWTHY